MLINIDQLIQYGIKYSVKYNRTNVVVPCVIFIKFVEANTIYKYLKTILSLTFAHTKFS